MERGKYRTVVASLAGGLWMLLIVGLSFAAEEAAPPAGAEPPKAEAPAAAPGAPAAAAPAPKLPPYFTATSPDPKTTLWPDPTGANSGVWATPAGDGKGDIPEKLSAQDVYDRMAHNLFSINFVWALVAGFLVMFMQAGFMFVETGLCRAKNASHTAAMNFDDLPAGVSRVLGLRLCDRLGQLVERTGAAGLVRVARSRPFGAQRRLGFGRSGRRGGKGHGSIHVRSHRFEGLVFDRRRQRRRRDGAVFLHDGIYGYHGNDTDRCDGRALGVEELLSLRILDRTALLSLRKLGLGWRLACSGRTQLGSWSWSRGLRRFRCRALDGWDYCACGSHGHWPAHRQIRFAGQAKGHAGSQRADGRARNLYSWLSAGSDLTQVRRLPGPTCASASSW